MGETLHKHDVSASVADSGPPAARVYMTMVRQSEFYNAATVAKGTTATFLRVLRGHGGGGELI